MGKIVTCGECGRGRETGLSCWLCYRDGVLKRVATWIETGGEGSSPILRGLSYAQRVSLAAAMLATFYKEEK